MSKYDFFHFQIFLRLMNRTKYNSMLELSFWCWLFSLTLTSEKLYWLNKLFCAINRHEMFDKFEQKLFFNYYCMVKWKNFFFLNEKTFLFFVRNCNAKFDQGPNGPHLKLHGVLIFSSRFFIFSSTCTVFFSWKNHLEKSGFCRPRSMILAHLYAKYIFYLSYFSVYHFLKYNFIKFGPFQLCVNFSFLFFCFSFKLLSHRWFIQCWISCA